MPQFCGSNIGCGAGEMYQLYGTDDKTVGDNLFSALRGCGGCPNYNLVIFGDGVRQGNGARWAKFLENYKLGEVVASKIVSNPSHSEASHEGYQAWFWYVDRPAVQAWYKERLEVEKAAAIALVAAQAKVAVNPAPVPDPYVPGRMWGGYMPAVGPVNFIRDAQGRFAPK